MHAKTREIQLNTWADLVLKYQKSLKQTILNINDENTNLFVNKGLNRQLNTDGRMMIMNTLEKSAHAAPIDPKKRDIWEVYWFTIDEWANMIYKWVSDNAMIGQVCTIFEIVNGDNSTDKEFYGLGNDFLLKILRRLEQNGKCELIDEEGVKFF